MSVFNSLLMIYKTEISCYHHSLQEEMQSTSQPFGLPPVQVRKALSYFFYSFTYILLSPLSSTSSSSSLPISSSINPNSVAGKQTRIFSRWPRASHFSAISSAKIGFSQTCEGDCRGHPPENLTPGLQENTGAEKLLPKSFVWTNRLDFDRLQLIWRFSLKLWET